MKVVILDGFTFPMTLGEVEGSLYLDDDFTLMALIDNTIRAVVITIDPPRARMNSNHPLEPNQHAETELLQLRNELTLKEAGLLIKEVSKKPTPVVIERALFGMKDGTPWIYLHRCH